MYLDELEKTECQSKSDEQILTDSLKNPYCFEVLLDRYQDAFMRKAMSILHLKEEAEEVVQEVFTKIYLNAHKFKVQEGASFNSWGYKILINTALTRYQKLKKQRTRIVVLDPEFYEMLPDTISRQFEKDEMYDYVISILIRIPDNLRSALTLHFLERRSQQEIADKEGVSVGAIKTRVHRAKKVFRDELKKLSSY